MLLSLLRKEPQLMQPDFLLTRRFLAPPPSLAPMPLPSPREMHFWYIIPDEVQKSCLLNQYLDLLSPCERDSVLRLNGDKLQKSALLARALVRTTLSRYTNLKVSPKSLKFRKNRFGKPEVDWKNDDNWVHPSLHFNVSHTSSMVACGVAVDMPIGIDIEEKHRELRNNILSFARRYFTPHEIDFLLGFSDPEIQRQELIKIWTLKEAYVKALGRGFSAAPFRDFTIKFQSFKNTDPGGFKSDASRIGIEPCVGSEIFTTNWQLALFELPSSHYGAVCMGKDADAEGGADSSLRLKIWKTIPFVEEECVSGTDAVVAIAGLS